MICDDATGWTEPTILVNGHTLSFAQAMSVRVAVSSFRLQLGDPAFQAGVGKHLARNYDAHLNAVERMTMTDQQMNPDDVRQG